MERRRTAIYLIIGVSLLAGLITGRTFFFNVTYAFSGLLMFSFLWAWSSARWLKLSRHTPARRGQVGHYFEERFTIRNTGFIPKLWLEIYDHSTLPGHYASHVISTLGIKAAVTWPIRTLCVQRGEFVLGPLRVVGSDPFGLFEIERKVGATSSLVVYPATYPIPSFELPSGILPGGDAVRRRTHQTTTNASAVRDYLPGDSFNRIHWPSTARKDRLIVKEFELDPLSDIWIMLDADQTVHAGETSPFTLAQPPSLGPGREVMLLPPATEEYAVSLVASLAQHFIEKARSVGLAVNGRHHERVQVDRGARQLTKFLEALAVVQVGSSLAFDHMLAVEGGQLSRGTTVIVVTPSTREGWVEAASRLLRRGLRVIVVLIDGETFGGRPGIRHVASRLAALRIPAYVVHSSDDFAGVFSVIHPR